MKDTRIAPFKNVDLRRWADTRSVRQVGLSLLGRQLVKVFSKMFFLIRINF